MKDAPLLRGSLPVRVVALFSGLVLIGFAIVCMLESELGLPPWDVFHQGISSHTPLTLGTAAITVGLVLMAIAWVGGAPPGPGTVANALVIGASVDVLSSIDAIERLSGSPLPAKIALLATGVALFGVGSALYIGAGMGAGPRDSLMLAISRRTGQRIGVVRAAIEITVLVSGLLLGGTAGIGTLTMALLVGPTVELSFWSLTKLGLALPRSQHVEFGPIDVA